jgi:hypothetical protein
MLCKDEDLVNTFKEHNKALLPMGYQPAYMDYTNSLVVRRRGEDNEVSALYHQLED